jgi:iron complex outermembrane receptor protein
VTDNTNLYFTFTKGFKSGEFNPAGAIRQVTPVAPEKVWSYEAGVKTSMGRVSFNLAAFYYDYKDLQVQSFQTINGALAGIVSNAASAKIKGLELSGDWRVTDAFHLSIGGSYLDTEYSQFPAASFTTPRRELATNTCPVPPSASPTAAICTISGDVSGNRLLRAPEWSGNVSATYTLDTSAGRFDATATLFASTKVYFDPSNRVYQPGYAQLNLNLTYSPPDSGFQARLYAKNLTDHPVLISLVNTTSYDNVTYSPPRSFGAELSYKF